MSTYISMFQRIARAAGLPSATSDFQNGSDNTASIKEFINESNMRNAAITPARPKKLDISMVAGTATYTLPSDYSKMNLVHYYQGTRFIEIKPLTPDKFLILQSVTSNSTMFTYYMVNKVSDPTTGDITNTITIFPMPGTTAQLVNISYFSIPPSLNVNPSVATDSAVNLVAVSPFEQLDKLYGLKEIFATREQWMDADKYTEKYDELFDEYSEYIKNNISSPLVKQGVGTQIDPNLYPVLS